MSAANCTERRSTISTSISRWAARSLRHVVSRDCSGSSHQTTVIVDILVALAVCHWWWYVAEIDGRWSVNLQWNELNLTPAWCVVWTGGKCYMPVIIWCMDSRWCRKTIAQIEFVIDLACKFVDVNVIYRTHAEVFVGYIAAVSTLIVLYWRLSCHSIRMFAQQREISTLQAAAVTASGHSKLANVMLGLFHCLATLRVELPLLCSVTKMSGVSITWLFNWRLLSRVVWVGEFRQMTRKVGGYISISLYSWCALLFAFDQTFFDLFVIVVIAFILFFPLLKTYTICFTFTRSWSWEFTSRIQTLTSQKVLLAAPLVSNGSVFFLIQPTYSFFLCFFCDFRVHTSLYPQWFNVCACRVIIKILLTLLT